MSFSSAFEPERIVSLTAVVDQLCLQAGIDLATPEGKGLAELVVVLFETEAATIEELKAALLYSSEREQAAQYGLLTLAFRNPSPCESRGIDPNPPLSRETYSEKARRSLTARRRAFLH